MEVPHWAAQLRVCDSRGQLLLRSDQMPIQAGPAEGSRKVWQATAELIPGIYEVELSLEGQTARQLAIVRDTEACHLSRESWPLRETGLTAAVPSAELTPIGVVQSRAAETWSRQPTGPNASGNSRLFLFVRTLMPEKNRRFFENLSLLDPNEKLITDFSKGVKANKKEGWMAFTADLPAGLYLLKRHRYASFRTKYQPLYLCEGWETHAFLLATKRPSLQTLTLSMAPAGTGFRADDETAGASGILTASLKRSINPDRLVTLDAINRLLSGRMSNPWLGILSAYIIRLQQDQVSSGDDPVSDLWPALSASWPMLMDQLSPLRDHPDVQSLQLTMDRPAQAPIEHPPLLYVGLRRVQQHALRFADTVPVNSFLKRVFPRVSTTSAWTAWRQTSQPAQAPIRHKDVVLESDAMADPAESFSQGAVIQSTAPDYLRLVSPKLPVYQVQTSAGFPQDTHSPPNGRGSSATVANALLNVLAIQATQNLSESRLDDMPTTTRLNATADIADLLNNDHAGVISQASGVPLAQVQNSLTTLQSTCQQPLKLSKNLTAYDRTVLGFAVQRAIEGMLGDPLLTTIEECVNKLLTEVSRLATPVAGADQRPAIEPLVGRINALADQLLLAARFVVVTDSNGKIALSNGVFVILLKEKAVKLTDWEAFFKTAPFGYSPLPYAFVNKGSPAWNLQRTVLHDDERSQVMYLNIFQNQDGLLLKPEQLKKLETLLPQLVLFTSSFAYDSSAQDKQPADGQHPLMQKMAAVLTKMEQALTPDG